MFIYIKRVNTEKNLANYIQSTLKEYQNLVEGLAQKALPASYGNCQSKNPPAPCMGSNALYSDDSAVHKITSHWITGLNKLQIKSLDLKSTNDSNDMSLRFVLNFDELPMRIEAEACASILGCTTILDNTNACCGKNRQLTMNMDMKCHETPPFIRNSSVSIVQIDPNLVVQPKLFGSISINAKDITSDVEKEIKKLAVDFVQGDAMEKLNDFVRVGIGEDQVNCIRSKLTTPKPTQGSESDASNQTTSIPSPSSIGILLEYHFICKILCVVSNIVWMFHIINIE